MSRQRKRTIKWTAVAAIGVLAVAVGLVARAPIEAQDHGGNGPMIEPSGFVTLTPEVRTAEDMATAAAARGPVTRRPRAVPFLPSVSPAEYAAQKAAAAMPGSGAPEQARGTALLATMPTLQFINFEGISAAESGIGGFAFAPSDSHGAVGHTQYMEGVNDAYRVFTKGTSIAQPSVVKTTDLQTFFNTTEDLFDPRVAYDTRSRRWIVVATRHSTSSTDTLKQFFLGVSRSTAADGSWCIYKVNFGGGVIVDGDWWDYPQLGMDLDALIITGNVFTGTDGFRTTAMMPLAKAQVYNCLSVGTTPKFTGLLFSTTPPIVRDQGGAAFLLAASGGVKKYTLTNSSRVGTTPATLTGPVSITGAAAFSVPPEATQPGTAATIDTLDGRFVNASSQIGSEIWNTHSVGVSGVARVKWYRINTSTNAVVQQGTVLNATSTTHDFNASIAVNDVSTAFMVYSTSSSALKPQIRFSGKLTGDAAIPLGTVLFTSPSVMSTNCSGACRWGDYSAVSVDPAATTKAWIVNQYSKTTNMFNWGTRIARIGS